MCDCIRPNEAFSGKGHKQHICKKCMRKPRQEREQIQTLYNINGFLSQRNISVKNMAYLKKMSQSSDEEIRRQAEVVLEIARIKPHKRNRGKFLAKYHPDLLAKFAEHGFWI